jgi:hypothetical protein
MSQRLDYIVKWHYSFIVLIYHLHLLDPVLPQVQVHEVTDSHWR